MANTRNHVRLVICTLVALGVTAAACGGGSSSSTSGSQPTTAPAAGPGTHAPVDVAAALKAAGLTGFHRIRGSQLVQDTPVPGIDDSTVPAAFVYQDFGTDSNIGVTVIVANDPTVFTAVRSTIDAQSTGTGADVEFSQAGNVLINTVAQHPSASQKQTLARVAQFVAALRQG